MKRHIFIMMLFALCLTSFQAHAQRYLPGMKGLQVTAGMTDGVHWNANTDFAYHIGAAYSVYTKNANRWVIGGEYLHKKYDYKDMRIPVEQFTAEGTGNLPDRPGGSAVERKGTGVVRLGHRQVPHAGIFGTEIHYQLTAI